MTHCLMGISEHNFLGFLKNDIIHVFSYDGTYRQEKLHEFIDGAFFVTEDRWFEKFEEWKTAFRHPDEMFNHIFDMTVGNNR